jgi:dynein heavy chain
VDAKLPCPDPEVMLSLPWDALYSAEIRCEREQFANITQHVSDNWKAWYAWSKTDNPYAEPCPGGPYQEALSSFDRLVLVRSWRPDMVQYAMSQYIIAEMGKFYVESPSVSMDILFADINTFTPLIFVLSTGADPTSTLLKFA